MDLSQVDIKRMDHLGLISGFCDEIGLVNLINKYIPKVSHRSKVSHGTLMLSMILNGLGFVSRTLHMYPDYFADKPIERLLGEDISASDINDDVLGRFLDALYEADASTIYETIALRVANHLGLECKSLNLDLTSFHVDGAYQSDIDATHIHITRGYSRDHRPDLNQVVLGLITENQAGIPLYMQACNGNANDTETFKRIVKSHIQSLKAAYNNTYLIGDAALYSEEIIKALSEQGQLYITRVPQKLNAAKEVIAKAKTAEWTLLDDGYAGCWFESSYGGVRQRWLLVKSQHAKGREKHILEAKIMKESERSLKSFKKLCRKAFGCEQDAKEAYDTWLSEQCFIEIEDCQIIRIDKCNKRGSPGKNDGKITHFEITGRVMTSLVLRQEADNDTGLFILATNDVNSNLSMQFLLDEYKSQQAVERGFRFLKSPDFLTSSLFLKKPERIEALLMVMTCSLMVYASIEHLIRRQLANTNQFFPDMKKKPTQSPTAKWVFFCFQGIHTLSIDANKEVITHLKAHHSIILNVLGPAYLKFYT